MSMKSFVGPVGFFEIIKTEILRRSFHTLFARLQPHADGSRQGNFPISAAIAVRIIVVLRPGSCNVSSLLFCWGGEDHGGIGTVPRYREAQRFRKRPDWQLVGSLKHEGFHGIALGIPEIQLFSI